MVTTSYGENDAVDPSSLSRHFLPEENDAFKTRFKEVLGKESARAFALRTGISPTVVRQYLAGKSLPGLDHLLAITKSAQVNLLWLATGEGLKRGESTGSASPVLDEAALVWALERVENAGAGLPSARKARLVAAFYFLYIRSGGAVDPAAAEDLVKAVLSNS